MWPGDIGRQAGDDAAQTLAPSQFRKYRCPGSARHNGTCVHLNSATAIDDTRKACPWRGVHDLGEQSFCRLSCGCFSVVKSGQLRGFDSQSSSQCQEGLARASAVSQLRSAPFNRTAASVDTKMVLQFKACLGESVGHPLAVLSTDPIRVVCAERSISCWLLTVQISGA